MNQREIKIPLSCGNFARVIGLVFISLYFLLIIPKMGSNLDNDLFLIAFPFLFWGLIEVLNYILGKFLNEEPILPFTFKCKCDEGDKVV